MSMYRRIRTVLILNFLFFAALLSAENAPVAFYLTWQRDPSTTMIIQWITRTSENMNEVQFKQHGANQWSRVQGNISAMPDKEPYKIHAVELYQLIPDTSYEFRIGSEGAIYKFRTMPADLKKPVRFIAAGDIYHTQGKIETLRQMNRLAASLNPHFILLGGDLVYADNPRSLGKTKPVDRWLEWLKSWSADMITADGRVIPMIPIIGNHEVKRGGSGKPLVDAAYFYSLFSFPGLQGYGVLDFGKYMTVVGLDSGHTHPVTGLQTRWLNTILKERSSIPYKFVIYHVAAFPSVRKWDGTTAEEIRKHWVPLFEEYGVNAVFENHDHAYKRSKLIKRGVVDPTGVLYFGDGGWAVDARTPRSPEEVWYLAKTAAARNMLLTIVEETSLHFISYDENGTILDEYIKNFNHK